jgi:hypothetical protein
LQREKISDILHENLNMFVIFLWIISVHSLFLALIKYIKYLYNQQMHFNFMILWWIITGEGHISDKIFRVTQNTNEELSLLKIVSLKRKSRKVQPKDGDHIGSLII